ncbi:MAG TPA: stalk domain-containing protein [Acetivibrio clariflavus]|nr:stalk domain-containing protein [Acetivibrio clariflavus]
MKLRYDSKILFFRIFFLAILALGYSVSLTTVQAAAQTYNNITVTVDWDELKFDVPPQIIEGRTMVPLRAIFEALDAQVEWDGVTRTVTGYRKDTVVSLVVDSKIATLNGKKVELDVPAIVVSGRTLVPVRFISESLGAKVTWDARLRKVEILTQDVIQIPDSNFEKVIRRNIKKYTGELFTSDLKGIKVLEGREAGISDIEGIQYMKNVTHIYLEKNNISDISLLAGLKELKVLSLN